jgi:hypothetical protein
VPRANSIAAAVLVLAALLVSGCVAPAGVAPDATAGEPPGGARRVFVVLAPYLTWSDIMDGPMPATRQLADEGLVADMNVRSGALGAGAPSVEKGALLLSAGASVVSDPGAMKAYSAGERVEDGTATDVYRRVFGTFPQASDVLYLGTPAQVLANQRATAVVEVGALGTAVRAAGGVTVALGSSDQGADARPELRSRPAGVAAADGAGLVDKGDVSARLIEPDVDSPFGVRTDIPALISAVASTVADLPQQAPALVVVDPGDLARCGAWDNVTTSITAERQRRAAVQATDRVVRAVAEAARPGDIVMVLGPVMREVEDLPPAFAPLVVRGAGLTGLVHTPSTHRDGICTLMDVSATTLELLGAEIPGAMTGSVIDGTGPGMSLAARVALLNSMNATAVSVEAVRVSAVNGFITIAVVVLLAASLLLFRGAPVVPARVRVLASAALVLVPCILLAGLLQFAVWGRPDSPSAIAWMLVATSAALWGVALAIGRGRHPATPLFAITTLTAVTLLVDQWVGAPLEFAGVFGYAPLFGARYYGIGNEMAGLLLGSAMTACAIALDAWPSARWAAPLRRWGWPVLGLVVVATAAAPFFGANVGAVAWMGVGFGAGWLMLNGRRVFTWRNAAVAVAVVLVAVAALTAADLVAGPGSSTHLGRAFEAARGEGGLASFVTLVARKAETNARVLGRTNWTWLLVAVLGLLGYMRWRPRGEFAAMLRERPAFSAVLGASLIAGVAGYLTEDSGIIVPALALLPVGVCALTLMLDGVVRRGPTGDGGEVE